jgi:N-acetylmuramoyl-L-alanine amidase
MLLLNPDNLRYIVLHCSASYYGDVETFNQWHREKGWDTIGYHWVITNCLPKYDDWRNKQPNPNYDGLIHMGRSETFAGAHVYGYNNISIGVVLTGVGGNFTSKQLISAAKLCHTILARYPSIIEVRGHYEFTSKKTCPDIDMDYFRKYILPLGVDDE